MCFLCLYTSSHTFKFGICLIISIYLFLYLSIYLSIYIYILHIYIYVYIYIYILHIYICIYIYIYIFKSGKIKLIYSCNSESHAKAIIRHIISFLSKNKERNKFVKFKIKIQKYEYIYTHETKVQCFSLRFLIKTCLNVCIY